MITGEGLGELREALDNLVATTPPAIDRSRPRLWIDRVFAAKGSGTVVTGTLTGGVLTRDHAVVIEPGGRPARVRSIQSFGSGIDRIGPGNRVALNLAGIAHDDVVRGDVVVSPGRWLPTRRFDATLEVLTPLDHDVSRRGAFLAYIGSREVPVKVRVIGSDALAPGTRGTVRLHLPVDLPLLPGDLYVLRESGRDETVGGGEVLDVAPVRPASKAAPDRTVERVIRERGWTDVHELELLTGTLVEPTVGRWAVADETLAATADRLRTSIAAAGSVGLDVAALDEQQRAVLDTLDGVVIDAGRARPAGTDDPFADHPVLAVVRAGGYTPPAVDECRPIRDARIDPTGSPRGARGDRVPCRDDRRRRPCRGGAARRASGRLHDRPVPRRAPGRAASTRCRSSPSSTRGRSRGAVATCASADHTCPNREPGSAAVPDAYDFGRASR